MPGLMRTWAEELPLMMQGVLVAAVRGCDGAPKEDPSKPLLRELRLIMLRNAKSLEQIRAKKQYMCPLPTDYDPDDVYFNKLINLMIGSMDHYPVHFLLHFMHAIEIVGYKHPDPSTRGRWLGAYLRFVHALHMQPESEELLDDRLCRQENDLRVMTEEPYPEGCEPVETRPGMYEDAGDFAIRMAHERKDREETERS